MKCNKCGKKEIYKNGLCKACYKKNIHSRKIKDPNYIIKHLDDNEKIITKIKTSDIMYAYIIFLFAISIILFPKTIVEFFWKHNNFYFPVLIVNIVIFFIGIYSALYFFSRNLYITSKRIIGKWGIFNVKILNAPLSKIESIDTFKIKALEICIYGNSYVFDFISNAESFKLDTINQIKHIINSANDEKVLLEFTHSLNEKLKEYKLNEEHPNMTYCKCCGETISKESKFCVHCGQPLPENEIDADWILKTICFLIPPLGLLIYLLNIGEHPKLSNQCLMFSVFGFFIMVTIYLSVASILSII